MRSSLRVLALAAIPLVAVACRRTPPGGACPVWTTARAGACEKRPFVLPAAPVADVWAAYPLVAIDARGRGIVAFASAPGLGVAEETAAGAWTVRRPTAALDGSSVLGALAAGPDGTAVVAWGQVEKGQGAGPVYLSERGPEGAWKDPSGPADAISFPPWAYGPTIAVNAKGEWLVAWNQSMTTPNRGVAVARRRSWSEPWQRPAGPDDVLSPRIFYCNMPVIALDDAGDALVTWYQSVGGPLMALYSERRGADAAFVPAGLTGYLSAPGGAVDSDPYGDVKPVVFPDGSAAVAWTQEDGKGHTLVYLATRDKGGAWHRPAGLDDAFSIAQGYARSVNLAAGPRGDLYVVWYQDAGFGNVVYAARRRPDGTWTEDGRHPVRLSTPGAAGIFPRVAVGPEGGVMVVWNEREGKAPMRVAARRTGGAGDPWGPIEVLSGAGPDDAVYPAVAVGPHDRAMVAWSGGPARAPRLFVARVE